MCDAIYLRRFQSDVRERLEEARNAVALRIDRFPALTQELREAFGAAALLGGQKVAVHLQEQRKVRLHQIRMVSLADVMIKHMKHALDLLHRTTGQRAHGIE